MFSRLENTGLFCDARTVPESQIEQVTVKAINQTLCDKDSFLITLRDNIAAVISRECDKDLADIDKRLEELQTELLNLATSNADYDKCRQPQFGIRNWGLRFTVCVTRSRNCFLKTPTVMNSKSGLLI